jgi:hypothetical protein
MLKPITAKKKQQNNAKFPPILFSLFSTQTATPIPPNPKLIPTATVPTKQNNYPLIRLRAPPISSPNKVIPAATIQEPHRR